MSQADWKPLVRNYKLESSAYAIPGETVTTHPLKKIKTSIHHTPSTNTYNIIHNNNNLESVPFDPLSAALNGVVRVETHKNKSIISELQQIVNTKDPEWTRQKASLLSQYLKMSPPYHFIDDYFELDRTLPVIHSISEKFVGTFFNFKTVPAELLTSSANFDTLPNCIDYIYTVNSNILYHWNQSQRVESLGCLINMLLLLENSSDCVFFGPLMVMAIEVLEVFSSLVYQRMLGLQTDNQNSERLYSVYKSDFDRSAYYEANIFEIGWNWIAKVESISSPFCRILIKLVIFKCYHIIIRENFDQSSFYVLVKSIRGISNPTLTLYVRQYAARIAHNFFNLPKDCFMAILNDFECEYSPKNIYDYSKSAPALFWIIHCIFVDPPSPTFCRENLSKLLEYQTCHLYLCSLIRSIPAEIVLDYVFVIFDKLSEMSHEILPKYIVCVQLGRMLIDNSSKITNHMNYLKKAWTIIDSISSLNEYLAALVVWGEFVSRFFQIKQIDSLTAAVADRVSSQTMSGSQHQDELCLFLLKIVTYTSDVVACFQLTSFRIILQLITNSANELEICFKVLSRFVDQHHIVTDIHSIDVILEVITIINGNIRCDASLEFRAEIEAKFIKFVEIVVFENDFEMQLQFYCDVRARSFKLPNVIIRLIHLVVKLLLNAFNLPFNEKNAHFMPSCGAFLLITITSLNDVYSRLRISPLCLHVAFITRCVGQGYAIFDLMFRDLSLIFADSSASVVRSDDHVAAYLSSIVLIPDDPFGSMIQSFTQFGDLVVRSDLPSFLKARYLCWGVLTASAISQKNYVINLKGVSANDLLYGSDPRFSSCLLSMASMLLSEFVKVFSSEDGELNSDWQEECLWQVVASSDLSDCQLSEFFYNNCFVNIGGRSFRFFAKSGGSTVGSSRQAKQNNYFLAI